MKATRSNLLRNLGALALVAGLTVTSGCGGGKRSPLTAAVVQGALFVPNNVVAREASAAGDLVPLAGATITLSKKDGTACTAVAGTAKTATTDAAGKWSLTVNDTSSLFISSITAPGYSFTALLNASACADRSVTPATGTTSAPPLLSAETAGAVSNTFKTLIQTNIVADTTATGTVTVNAVINDPVSSTYVPLTGSAVTVGGVVREGAVTGTAFGGVLLGAKVFNVSPTQASLTAPTSGSTLTVVTGTSNAVTITLSRKVATVTIDTPDSALSTGSTFDFDPQCTYAAVTGTSLTNGPIDCPAGTVTFSIDATKGSFSGDTLTVGTITATTTATVTITGPTGATLPANPTINLTNCPANSESIPSGGSISGCGRVTAITVVTPSATVYQTKAIDLDLTASCTYNKVDNNSALVSGQTGNFTCPASGLTFTATGLDIVSNKLDLSASGTAQVSVARGTVSSSAATAIVVTPRVLTGIAMAFAGGATTATVNYSGTTTPSPTTLTVTPTCTFNPSPYTESLSCLGIEQVNNPDITPSSGVTVPGNFLTLGTDTVTVTPPSTIPDTGGTITVTLNGQEGSTVITGNTLTLTLAAGPQTCNGVTTFCIDLPEVTGTASTAANVAVTATNIPTGGLGGATVVFTYPSTVTFSDTVTVGTGWTKISSNNDTTNHKFSVVLQATNDVAVTGTTTFFTLSATPASAGTHLLTPVITGTGRTSITAADLSNITAFTFQNGRITVQ